MRSACRNLGRSGQRFFSTQVNVRTFEGQKVALVEDPHTEGPLLLCVKSSFAPWMDHVFRYPGQLDEKTKTFLTELRESYDFCKNSEEGGTRVVTDENGRTVYAIDKASKAKEIKVVEGYIEEDRRNMQANTYMHTRILRTHAR